MWRPSGLRSAGVAVLLAGALLSPSAPAIAAVPRPIEVEPLGGDVPAELVISPAATVVEVPADGTATTVTHRIVNGGSLPLRLRLETVPLAVGPAGAPVLSPSDTTAVEMTLPETSVTVGAGEQARVVSGLRVAPGVPGSRAVALRATSVGTEPVVEVVGYVAGAPVEAPGSDAAADPDPSSVSLRLVHDTEPPSIHVQVTGDADRHRVVDLRVRLRSWLGRNVVDETVAGLLLAPTTTRELTLPVTDALAAGRYRLEAVAGPAGAPAAAVAHAQETVWLWPPATLLVGVLVLVLGVAAVVEVRRRRRRGSPRL